MKFSKRYTNEEQIEEKLLNDSNYLGRRVVADPADLRDAYKDNKADLGELRGAYSNNNWKIGLGLVVFGGAAEGLKNEFTEEDLSTAIEAPASPSTSENSSSMSISIDLGGSLLFAFAGAALVASGYKGRDMIRSHIKERLSKTQAPSQSAPEVPTQG